MLLGINSQQQICLILVGDIKSKLPKWCPNDKDNKASQEIDIFTATLGYSQMIGKTVNIINENLSRMDLLFTSYSNFVL